MKKGFTLIELMAVITVLVIITLAVVPSIIKQVSEKKEEVNQTTLDLIYNAANLYTSNDTANYKTEIGNVYCITLENLVKEELLDKNITNFKTGKSIPLNRVIKVTVNSYYEFEYELLAENEECNQSTSAILAEVVSVGDYVAYDAGSWTATTSKPTSQGNFGGYTSGQNKANSVEWCYTSDYTTSLKGWRVLSVDKDTKTVTLVHAGHPECYYHAEGYSSESITALNNRATSEYLNSDYASSAHMMTYDEAYAITGSTSSTTNDLRYIGASGTTGNNAYYWLTTAVSDSSLYSMCDYGFIDGNYNFSFGVRPVIVLKSGIKTTGKGTDVVGQEAWTLVKS